MDRKEQRIITLTILAHALSHAHMLIYPAVLVLMLNEFSTGFFRISLLGNFAALAYGLGALPAGFLVDRWGSRRLITVSLLGTAVSCVLIGLSSNFLWLAVGMGSLGIFGSLYHPAGLSWLSRGVRAQGKAMGYHGVGGNLGMALTPFIAGAIASARGWRSAYLAFAVPGLLLGALMLIGGLDRRRKTTTVTSWERVEPATTDTYEGLLLVYAISILAGFIYNGSLTFLPTYLSQRVTLSLWDMDATAMGGLLTTVALSVGIVGQYIGGYLAEGDHPERRWATIAAVYAPCLIMMTWAVNVPLIVLTVGFITIYFSGQPISSVLIARFTSAQWRGRSYGVSFFLAFGLGSFATGMSGYIAERFGMGRVFYALGGVGLMAMVLTLALTLVGRRKREQQQQYGLG